MLFEYYKDGVAYQLELTKYEQLSDGTAAKTVVTGADVEMFSDLFSTRENFNATWGVEMLVLDGTTEE